MHSAAMLTLCCIDYIETPFFTAILDSAYYLLVPSALPRRIHRLVPFPPRPSHPPSLHLVLPSRDIDLHSVHSIIILLLLSLHDREPQPSPELIPYSIRSFHRHRHRRTTPARATLHIQPTPDELRPDTRHLSAPSGFHGLQSTHTTTINAASKRCKPPDHTQLTQGRPRRALISIRHLSRSSTFSPSTILQPSL